MSWLFGRKKCPKDSPSDSTEEERATGQTGQTDDYVLVNKYPDPMLPNTTRETNAYTAGNLYPLVPPVSGYGQTLVDDSLKEYNQGEYAHYLTGVPFKLCKQLDNNLNNNLEVDKLRISEILSFIQRIKNQNYGYSFSVEGNVISEMNSRNCE